MEDFAPFTVSLAPSLQLVIGLLAAVLIGAAGGYMARLWQEPRFRLDDEDAARTGADDDAGHERARPIRGRRPATKSRRTTRTRTTRTAPDPLRAPTPRPKRPATRTSAPAPVEAGSATVLVADDRTELLNLHAAYLERNGYRVVTATDGDAALALARAEHPAVIVLDHSMPGRSGIEVTRALKSDPATADIPVILMTAHSYGAIGANARAAGCAAFMPKPCDPTRVLREVAAFVPLAPAGQA